ncbi:TIR domain-containing protein [Campylobacter sp. MIT 21-1685]|uniref:TIR domain-containing protein n=1 Tax=unclassified Campylobacter TaxID=2593542 RepID=UPI00224A9FC8|nr:MULTISPECIES: TIR domain-containing protein [unclassified Campylobacter]MCX2683396.1 TIR domain-containing protein [Campylobacter sp. MIT 21-1684]MCX2751677.1 TIR domain-containing protein [Campylobacter sp. MIT 21-1682]MCX2807878.1 TIR domain-containing protein [Campylobacter sp. MIT 21-1685]
MKKVFFSFHYDLDNWRVQQIRNMGVVENEKICNPNDWEQTRKKDEQNIKNWIDKQMKDCDCVIVLIGERTHTRKWVEYEVKRAKELGIPIFGIFIHNLKDNEGKTTKKGENRFKIPYYEPKPNNAYQDISNNLESWINKTIIENKGKK